MIGEGRHLSVGNVAVGAGELAHRTGEDATHGPRRVECRVGVLEDDLHRSLVGGAALGDRAGEIVLIQGQLRPGVGGVDPEDRLGQCRLPGARLADEAQCLAVGQRQIDPHQRRDQVPVALSERLRHADDRQDLGAAGRRVGDRAGDLLEGRDLVRVVAAGQVAATDIDQLGRDLPAGVGDQRAAIDVHARRQVGPERGKRAGDRRQGVLRLAHAAARDRMQQPDGVRVLRRVEQIVGNSLLDDLAGVHHTDPVAHRADHAEVVGDHQDRRTGFPAKRAHQVEHLRLDRRVEACGRFVEHQQLRVAGQRHRDHDALQHAARQLVRIPRHDAVGVGDLHLAQRRDGVLGGLRLRLAEHVEGLDELSTDAQRRVQRRARLLVHHRCFPGPKAAQFTGRHRRDVGAVDQHAARGDRSVAWQVAQRGERRGRLSATRLTDQTEGLAGLDRERHAAQDRSGNSADRVRHVQIADLERGRCHGAHCWYTDWMESAIRLTAITIDMMARAGNSVDHQILSFIRR